MMITTVTLNAAIDRTMLVPNFQVGRRHRASESVALAGGRGVTVARALKRLGRPVIATGLAGGMSGDRIVEMLTHEGILNDFLRIDHNSRTSIAVVDPITGSHSEIHEHGPRVTPAELEQFFEKVQFLAAASHCFILAGTLPRDVPNDTYQRLVRMLNNVQVMTVVNSPGEALRLALAAEPDHVMAKQHEAEEVVGYEFGSTDDFVIALDTMSRMGAHNVIITTDEGCVARIRRGKAASYYQARHEPLELLSAIGATDVFIAGYMAALLDEKRVEDCLRQGLATKLANHRILGAGKFEPADVQRCLQAVSVEELQAVEQEPSL